MELNAEQVKKALECCHSHSYKNCPECPYNKDTKKACFMLLMEHSLALITSQEQRIKELTEQAYRLECDLQLNADEKAVAKAIEQTKKATVRKMQSEIKERCIKGGIYPAFVARTIDQIAKEMLEGGVT
jgi:hypothetical protein